MTLFRATNPATGAPGLALPETDTPALERHLDAAVAAFDDWSSRPTRDRAGGLRALARVLRDRATELATCAADEMGKPMGEARAEVEKCALACATFADLAEDRLAPRAVPSDASRSYVRHDPLGVILAIMPWNFPFWQVIRFAAPALAAGNVSIVKHAASVPGCTLALTGAARAAGLPAGVLDAVFLSDAATTALIADRRIAAVTLTGSVRAGRAVGAAAGAAIKPCVLELGGSDPCIVLADCDLDAAVAGALLGRMINAGQSCIASKRIIVADAIHDAFVARFEAALRALPVGDPRAAETRVGPLARRDLRDALHDQVLRSVAAGARLVCGGVLPSGPGWFYPPTLLAGTGPGMPAFDEETFGPVAAITRARDTEHAFALGAATCFGLGASVWTGDAAEVERRVARMRLGHVAVNGIVKSDPRLPFGGARLSGVGRELGDEGLFAFAPPKTVWIA